MKTKNAIPHYATNPNLPRSWTRQNTQAGHVILHHRRRTAPAGPWPPGSIITPTSEHPAISNRRLRGMLFTAWKTLLTSTERAAWTPGSVYFGPTNYKGAAPHPNAFEMYLTWNLVHSTRWYISGSAFTPDTSLIIRTPPAAWHYAGQTPITTPSYVRPGTFSYAINAGYLGHNPTSCFWAISPIAEPSQTAPNRKFSAINNGTATLSGVNLWTFTCPSYRNIIEYPPKPGLRQIRFTMRWENDPGYFNQWRMVKLDLSINVG